MADGWHGAGEVTSVFSPIVVEIEATLDGKPYSARSDRRPDAPCIRPTLRSPIACAKQVLETIAPLAAAAPTSARLARIAISKPDITGNAAP
ncbi:MAG TPA: hypothetical protein VII56_16840 [Rhizomicrobium sp.]